jgi:hypothetical protein
MSKIYTHASGSTKNGLYRGSSDSSNCSAGEFSVRIVRTRRAWSNGYDYFAEVKRTSDGKTVRVGIATFDKTVGYAYLPSSRYINRYTFADWLNNKNVTKISGNGTALPFKKATPVKKAALKKTTVATTSTGVLKVPSAFDSKVLKTDYNVKKAATTVKVTLKIAELNGLYDAEDLVEFLDDLKDEIDNLRADIQYDIDHIND